MICVSMPRDGVDDFSCFSVRWAGDEHVCMVVYSEFSSTIMTNKEEEEGQQKKVRQDNPPFSWKMGKRLYIYFLYA